MSFLARTTLRSTRIARPLTLRPFSTTIQARKSPTETVKDGLKTVDRAVADKLVDGIEVGEKVTQKAKEVAGMSSSEMKGKASEMAGDAKGTAYEMKGEAKGKAHEMAGKAEGKANEVKGKL